MSTVNIHMYKYIYICIYIYIQNIYIQNIYISQWYLVKTVLTPNISQYILISQCFLHFMICFGRNSGTPNDPMTTSMKVPLHLRQSWFEELLRLRRRRARFLWLDTPLAKLFTPQEWSSGVVGFAGVTLKLWQGLWSENWAPLIQKID